MKATGRLIHNSVRLGKFALFLVTCLVLASFAAAQGNVEDPTLAARTPGTAKLPQDTGTAGLKLMLKRLNTTARLLHTDAHPDDEDGGMLVLESRGKGVDATLLTLNRGEGGQNKIGSTLFDVLGVVRTLELLAADRYYDVHQRFTRVADFGFSKSADETFQKWGGHDVPLRDMVRVIRMSRPDVIVSRFQGNERDGHGHHQAAGILTREAFRAAADPTRFPEQIKEGLQPWQAKKLYIDNIRPFGQGGAPKAEDYTLALDTGATDPALGMSYLQFAMQGLRFQLSQGAGSWNAPPGPHVSYYKLVDSVLPELPAGTHEKDFFDGIDTSIEGLSSRLEDEERKVTFLRPELKDLQQNVNDAVEAVKNDPASAAGDLLSGYNGTKHIIDEVKSSSLSGAAKDDLLTQLETKRDQFLKAANLALGISMVAIVGGAQPSHEGFMAVRGGTFEVAVTFTKPSIEVKVANVKLDVPSGWAAKRTSPITAQKNVVSTRFSILVAPDAPYTRPCEHRDSVLEPVFQVENDACAVLPLPRPVAYAVAEYDTGGHWGQISAPIEVRFVQQDNSVGVRPLAVGPKFSVAVEPAMRLFRIGQSESLDVDVSGTTNVRPPVEAAFKLGAIDGWGISQSGGGSSTFTKPGEVKSTTYQLIPRVTSEGQTRVQAGMVYDGSTYREGYTLVSRPDIGSALYYQPAVENVSAINVKLPQGLKVGYIMGAGDDIPSALQQLGMDVTVISPHELVSDDLNKYGTIVLGIRVYDTRDDVRANNKKLLEYVQNGGTLVVQYNANTSEFNSGQFTPYPAQLSRDRVTVEEAPVDVLAPKNSIFHFPNEISQSDFNGWVQERGLYFMSKWDDHYQPLLSSHDPGEEPLKGGLVRAQYGKGTYIYTGYAFFRQLPMGVPGAVRLFVNLISAGHER